MPGKNLEQVLQIYNPWWDDPKGRWRDDNPDYRRPVVQEMLSDLAELPQMLSLTGSAPGGKIEQFCREIHAWGKGITTLDGSANAHLVSLGIRPVRA
jgi:hypothetical protein